MNSNPLSFILRIFLCHQLNHDYPANDNVDMYCISMRWFRQWEMFVKGQEHGMLLKTAPPLVTAHTFCAFRDGPKKKKNKQKPEDGAHKHKYEYDVLFSNDTGKLGKRLRVSLLNDTSFSFVHQAQNITSHFLSMLTCHSLTFQS